jgi:hypothetical protein
MVRDASLPGMNGLETSKTSFDDMYMCSRTFPVAYGEKIRHCSNAVASYLAYGIWVLSMEFGS